MPYADPERQRQYSKTWMANKRKNNPELAKTDRTNVKNKARVLMADLKSGPCTDCGVTFPAVCMDFDHVPGRGDKIKEVSKMARSSGAAVTARISAEIAKCDLVCANCHRIRSCQRNPGCPG